MIYISDVLSYINLKFSLRNDVEYTVNLKVSNFDIDCKEVITNEVFHKAASNYKKSLLDNKYKENRAKEYPEVFEQLDMIYHDQIDNGTRFKDAIKLVKDKYPKQNQKD